MTRIWKKALLDLAYLVKFIVDHEIFYNVPFMIICSYVRPAGISYFYIYFDCSNCPIFTVTPQMGVSARVAISCLLQLLLFFLSVCSRAVHLVDFDLIAGSTDFFSHIGFVRVGLSENRGESNYLYLFFQTE